MAAERLVLAEDQHRPPLGPELRGEAEGERPGHRLAGEMPDQPVLAVEQIPGTQVNCHGARGQVEVEGRPPPRLQPVAEADAPEGRRARRRRQGRGDLGQHVGEGMLLDAEEVSFFDRRDAGDAGVAAEGRRAHPGLGGMRGDEVGREGLLLGQDGVGGPVELARFLPGEAEVAFEPLGEDHRVHQRPQPFAEAVAPRGEKDLARRRGLGQDLDPGEVEVAAARQAQAQEPGLERAGERQDERRARLGIAVAAEMTEAAMHGRPVHAVARDLDRQRRGAVAKPAEPVVDDHEVQRMGAVEAQQPPGAVIEIGVEAVVVLVPAQRPHRIVGP